MNEYKTMFFFDGLQLLHMGAELGNGRKTEHSNKQGMDCDMKTRFVLFGGAAAENRQHKVDDDGCIYREMDVWWTVSRWCQAMIFNPFSCALSIRHQDDDFSPAPDTPNTLQYLVYLVDLIIDERRVG